MSQRLLLAIADRDVASSAAALAQEGEGLEVVAVVDEPEEVSRALRRHDVDVVVLHDALGAVPVLDLARELGQAFPETGLVLIAADDSPELLRAAMQAGLRDVVALPLSLEQLEASVRAAAQWSRTLRERVAGEESAAGALGGRLIAVAGAKGGVGTTTVALQLALAAIRAHARPAGLRRRLRPRRRATCARSSTSRTGAASSTSSRSRPRSRCATCRRRSTRTTRASACCSRPRRASAAEEIDSGVARSVLNAVKARHALTVVDLGAQVSEASAIGAEIANGVVVVTTPDVVALRGVRRLRDLWRRLEVRDDEDVRVVLNRASRKLEIQPDLARKVVGADARADHDPRRLRRVRDRGQHRLAGARGGRQAARRVRRARGRARRAAGRRGARGARAARAAACSRGSAASAARRARRRWACCRCCSLFVLALWQLGLVGYTYVLAGHAAQEGARMLAVNPTDGKPDDEAYKKIRTRAMGEVPKAWRERRRGRGPGRASRRSPCASRSRSCCPG